MTEIEIVSAAAEIASAAMDSAASSAGDHRLEEAAIAEKAGQTLIARANEIRRTEGTLLQSFAAAKPEAFSEHRAAERLKAATEKAQIEKIEAAKAKVHK